MEGKRKEDKMKGRKCTTIIGKGGWRKMPKIEAKKAQIKKKTRKCEGNRKKIDRRKGRGKK